MGRLDVNVMNHYGACAFRDESAELVKLISQGCELSFRELVEETRSRLFAVIFRINTDRSQAEEVLQETYLKVWREADCFCSSKATAGAWLNAIARNAAIDSIRRNACRPHFEAPGVEIDTDPYHAFVSPLPGPMEILISGRQKLQISASLELLSVEHRTAVKLSFFEGLSHQEIATLLGKPLGSIKTLIRRALKSMQLSAINEL